MSELPHPPSFPFPWRLAAVLTLGAFLTALPGCTRQAVRPPVTERHYQVDWDTLRDSALALNGLDVRGALLTPTQFPLEASFKRAASLDFVGVWESLDFRFHASTIPEGGVKRLYDAGYLPVFARIYNPAAEPLNFNPAQLAVYTGGDPLVNVPPESLPQVFSELDIGKTVGTVVGALFLTLVMVASLKEGRSRGFAGSADIMNVTSRLVVEVTGNSQLTSSSDQPVVQSGGTEPGLLEGGVIPPGVSREGFLFFHMEKGLVNWDQARLILF
ncbi:MAG: hypothetical protein OEW39_10555 [Deltaproteobacteria bacterium]|nr:hypothetical protein [Deltaproteobacteria bacterium]